MSGACINYLVNERSREADLGTFQIQIMKSHIDEDGTLFCIHKNGIRNPSGIRDGVYKAYCAQLVNLGFDHCNLGRVNGLVFLTHMHHIKPCINVMFHDG